MPKAQRLTPHASRPSPTEALAKEEAKVGNASRFLQYNGCITPSESGACFQTGLQRGPF